MTLSKTEFDNANIQVQWVATDGAGVPIAPGQVTITCTIDDSWTGTGVPTGQGDRNDAAVSASVTAFIGKLDLSVNNDDDLTDPVDGAEKYLPGYEGDVAKVSTGTSFNTPGYTGQEMKLVLDGIGTNTGADSIEFVIDTVTSIEGFCENGRDPSLTSTTVVNGTTYTRDDDFSFAPNYDRLRITPTIGANSTTVSLWCKDYGGKATLTAFARKGTTGLAGFSVTIPLDLENNGGGQAPGDGIADKWEKEKVKEWNTQFGTTEIESNAFFTATGDTELIDPDGTANLLSFTAAPALAPLHIT